MPPCVSIYIFTACEPFEYRSVVERPQQKLPSKKGRIIIQNKYHGEFEGKEMLLRIVGLEENEEFNVITVYKTSKIDKYWIKEEQNESHL